MREFEGFVFDLDNTAVPEGSFSVQSKPLLRAFHSLDASIPAIAATGRSLEFAVPVISEFQLYHESIVANGAQVIDSRTERILEQSNLSVEQVSRIIELSQVFTSTAHFCIAGDPMDSRYTAKEQIAREAPGVFILDLDEKTALAIRKQLSLDGQVNAYISTSIEDGVKLYDVNIGNTEAEKGRALVRLLSKKEINPLNMVAIGDSINDMSLFDVVGYRVAVADADPQLLRRADEIVPPQSEDGLLEVVKRFL